LTNFHRFSGHFRFGKTNFSPAAPVWRALYGTPPDRDFKDFSVGIWGAPTTGLRAARCSSALVLGLNPRIVVKILPRISVGGISVVSVQW